MQIRKQILTVTFGAFVVSGLYLGKFLRQKTCALFSKRRPLLKQLNIHSQTQIGIISILLAFSSAQAAYSVDGSLSSVSQPSVQFTLQQSSSFNGANAVAPRLSLADAIARLEGSGDRTAVVQSLADVFTAAAGDTQPARTTYKYRIVDAINSKRAALGNSWDQVLRYESGEVKRRVDPFRTVDLKSYLQMAPYVGGAGYLAALLVQKVLPELFVFAYPAAVAALVLPALFIIIFS